MFLCSYAQITGIKISGDTCTNFTLDLQVIGTSSSSCFFWHFNDPASGINDSITITGLSPSPFPTHTFTSPGIYNVCVSFQEPGFPVTTICRSISIGLCCDGFINTMDSCLQNAIPYSFNTGVIINSISWNFGDPASGGSNSSSALNPTHLFTTVGTYIVTANVNALCGTFSDTSIITIVNCNSSPCIATMTYNDTCLNTATSFQLNSNYPITSVIWNFGDPGSGASNSSTVNNPSHNFTLSGTYNVKAIVNLDCGVDTINKVIQIVDCSPVNNSNCLVSFSNAFSPNNDNLNDFLVPLTSCTFEKYALMIYNRWGQLVFESNNPANNWDGYFKGAACPVGVYGYLLKYRFVNRRDEIIKGDVTLLK